MKPKHYIYREQSTGDGDSGGGSAVVDTSVEDKSAPAGDPVAKADPVAGSKAETVSDQKADQSVKADAKGPWPDQWRELMAGDDEKYLKQLQRYASPLEVAKKAKNLETRLSSGELKAPLQKDASPETIKEWRAQNGIPEAPEKYDLDIGGGRKIGDEDKPFVNQFLKNAHETNQTPEQVKASLRAYYDIQDGITEQVQANDRKVAEATEETLRSEWGGEYKRNLNLVKGLLDGVGGAGLQDKFLHGRLADGTPIGASPEAMRMLVSLALINNPAGTVVNNEGGNVEQAVSDEIGKIEKFMRENRKAYDKDEKVQARYRELIEADLKLKARGK